MPGEKHTTCPICFVSNLWPLIYNRPYHCLPCSTFPIAFLFSDKSILWLLPFLQISSIFFPSLICSKDIPSYITKKQSEDSLQKLLHIFLCSLALHRNSASLLLTMKKCQTAQDQPFKSPPDPKPFLLLNIFEQLSHTPALLIFSVFRIIVINIQTCCYLSNLHLTS